MLAKAYSATPRGVGALFVTVEVDRIRAGKPRVTVVGLPDTAVREAKDRMFAAIRRLGHKWEAANVVINLAPADEKKEGATLDLAMAMAFLAAAGHIPRDRLSNRLLMGELSLEGRLQPIRGVLPVALAARDRGFAEIVVPASNAHEARAVGGLDVIAAPTIGQVVDYLQNGVLPEETSAGPTSRPPIHPPDPDLADVVGQEQARRALEVAAAGGHHLLLMGPPGSGKSMLARRLPGILPALNREESLETTCVYSVSTRVSRPTGLMETRPFRAPHHTVSGAALIGGGSSPQPGEVSLAHNGVLFLDELTEFRRDALEGMRQPLEDGSVTVARARSSLTFPAGFQLVAAANPCPCGYLGDDRRECTCTPNAVMRYTARLSGPLLDRIDLQIVVPAVPWKALSEDRRGEPSRKVAERVSAARERQEKRFHRLNISCNREIGPDAIRRFAHPEGDGRRLLEQASQALCLSARAWHRILRVSRTIADLAGSDEISSNHIAEAIAYRCLDRQAGSTPVRSVGDWARQGSRETEEKAKDQTRGEGVK